MNDHDHHGIDIITMMMMMMIIIIIIIELGEMTCMEHWWSVTLSPTNMTFLQWHIKSQSLVLKLRTAMYVPSAASQKPLTGLYPPKLGLTMGLSDGYVCSAGTFWIMSSGMTRNFLKPHETLSRREEPSLAIMWYPL
jgi:hypothetical protein